MSNVKLNQRPARIEGHPRVIVVERNPETGEEKIVRDETFQNIVTQRGLLTGLVSLASGSLRMNIRLAENGSEEFLTSNLGSNIILSTNLATTGNTTAALTENTALSLYTESDTNSAEDYTEVVGTYTVGYTEDNDRVFNSVLITSGSVGSQVSSIAAITLLRDSNGTPFTIDKNENLQIIVTYTFRIYRYPDYVHPFTIQGVPYKLLVTSIRRSDPTKDWINDSSSIVGRGVPRASFSQRREDDLLVYGIMAGGNADRHRRWEVTYAGSLCVWYNMTSLLGIKSTTVDEVTESVEFLSHEYTIGADPLVTRYIRPTSRFAMFTTSERDSSTSFMGRSRGALCPGNPDDVDGGTSHFSLPYLTTAPVDYTDLEIQQQRVYILDDTNRPVTPVLPVNVGMRLQITTKVGNYDPNA